MQYSRYSQRWYDNDPTVSLAISLLRNTTPANQAKVAEFILKNIQDKGVKIVEKKRDLLSLFSYRWYDSNKQLLSAFETLKSLDIELQKEISVEMIDFLCKLDESISNGIV